MNMPFWISVETQGAHVGDQCARALDRSTGPVERGEEAVSGGIDLIATELRETPANHRVVAVEEVTPRTVADLRRALGRADDVGAENRREHAIATRKRGLDGRQLSRLTHGDVVGVVVDPVVDTPEGRRQLDESRSRNLLGEVPARPSLGLAREHHCRDTDGGKHLAHVRLHHHAEERER